MVNILNSQMLKDINFGVTSKSYIAINEMSFKGINIPRGYVFDGVTVRAPFTFVFSNNDLRKGIMAACFHDYMCEHKHLFKRRDATSVLVKLWKQDGLGDKLITSWKPWFVYVFVEAYHFIKGWK